MLKLEKDEQCASFSSSNMMFSVLKVPDVFRISDHSNATFTDLMVNFLLHLSGQTLISYILSITRDNLQYVECI